MDCGSDQYRIRAIKVPALDQLLIEVELNHPPAREQTEGAVLREFSISITPMLFLKTFDKRPQSPKLILRLERCIA